MLGITVIDRMRNEEICRQIRVDDIIECITRLKWRWLGLVAPVTDCRWAKEIREYRPQRDKSSREDL